MPTSNERGRWLGWRDEWVKCLSRCWWIDLPLDSYSTSRSLGVEWIGRFASLAEFEFRRTERENGTCWMLIPFLFAFHAHGIIYYTLFHSILIRSILFFLSFFLSIRFDSIAFLWKFKFSNFFDPTLHSTLLSTLLYSAQRHIHSTTQIDTIAHYERDWFNKRIQIDIYKDECRSKSMNGAKGRRQIKSSCSHYCLSHPSFFLSLWPPSSAPIVTRLSPILRIVSTFNVQNVRTRWIRLHLTHPMLTAVDVTHYYHTRQHHSPFNVQSALVMIREFWPKMDLSSSTNWRSQQFNLCNSRGAVTRTDGTSHEHSFSLSYIPYFVTLSLFSRRTRLPLNHSHSLLATIRSAPNSSIPLVL